MYWVTVSSGAMMSGSEPGSALASSNFLSCSSRCLVLQVDPDLVLALLVAVHDLLERLGVDPDLGVPQVELDGALCRLERLVGALARVRGLLAVTTLGTAACCGDQRDSSGDEERTTETMQ